jgi:hypothetical protein
MPMTASSIPSGLIPSSQHISGEEIIHDDTRDSDDDVFIDPGEDTDDPDY